MTELPPLILASASRYRAELLRRLRLPFETVPADVDETPAPEESPADLVRRLAVAKAEAVLRNRPRAVVIGSDQVAALDGTLLGKPGRHDAAAAQLRQAAGRDVTFLTSVCVAASGSTPETAVVPTQVAFRTLTGREIDAYLRAEQPWDCAGSFRAEAFGIVLFRRLASDDPTALIGLPLIALSRMLRARGYPLPD